MANKQTAVEWLINQLFNESTVEVTKENNPDLFEVLEKAKAMEKEQIIETYDKAHSDGYKDIDKFGEQYYNERFKSEKS